MPIREYRCAKCNYEMEIITDNNDDEIPCLMCNEPAQKKLSAASFKINGYNEKNGYSNFKKKR